MKYSISAKKIELSEIDHGLIDSKLSRIHRYLNPPYEASLVINKDSHHKKGKVITCTLKIVMGKNVFYSERQEESLPDALDEIVKVMRTELRRFREKQIDYKRNSKFE